MFQAILKSSIDPPEKTQKRMDEEAFMVQVGGSDKMTHALTNITYCLLANKGTALAKLREELTTAMSDAHIRVGMKTLEKLPYLASRFSLVTDSR